MFRLGIPENHLRRVSVRITVIALAILLSGCTMFKELHDEQEIDNWAKDGESLAEAGRMKWSDYYSQYLHKITATPVTGQGLVAERLGIMITASQFYEQGRLDKDGFDSVRRVIGTYQTIDDAAANLLVRQALVRALERKESAAGQKSAAAPNR